MNILREKETAVTNGLHLASKRNIHSELYRWSNPRQFSAGYRVTFFMAVDLISHEVYLHFRAQQVHCNFNYATEDKLFAPQVLHFQLLL